MDIIYPPTLDYAHMIQRPQHLMRQFASCGHRVFFCNLTQLPGRKPETVMPNLYVVHDHEAFCRDPVYTGPLVWCSWAKLAPTLDRYRPAAVIYDCVDDFPEWRRFEEGLLRRADLVVAASSTLYDRLQALHAEVILAPNGCDFAHFAGQHPHPKPDDLPPHGPIAGFVGAWAPWVDARLLAYVAAHLPHWQFVVVGPPFGGRPVSLPNVSFLGWRPYHALPGYLHHFDAALLPFIDNEVTRASNPIKLWEYLAAGCPVVSTPIPAVTPFRDLVSVALSGPEFTRAVEQARHQRTPELISARQAVAKRHDWSQRYQVIAQALIRLGLLRNP